MDPDPYAVLGVTRDDSMDTIKRKHKRLSHIYHSDHTKDLIESAREEAEEQIRRINVAFDAISKERAQQKRAEQERAEQERAQQKRAQQERAARDRIQRERERAERERAERQRADRERAERQRAEREQAERKRAERERAERQRAEREQAERKRRLRRRIGVISAASVAVIAAVTTTIVLLTRPAPPGSVSYIATGPDGSLFDVSLIPLSDNVTIWNIATRRVVATLTDPRTQGVADIALSADGKELATSDDNGKTYIWDVSSRHLVATLNEGGGVVALSTDGKTLAEDVSNNQILVWDVASRSAVATLHAAPPNSTNSDINSIALSPDGKSLAVSLVGAQAPAPPEPAGVELWDIAEGRIVSRLSSDYGGGQVIFSPSGLTLVTWSVDPGTFTLWADANNILTKNMTLNDPLPPQSGYTSLGNGSAMFSPDGNTLATADGSPTDSAFLWNLGTGHIAATLTDPDSKGVVDLAYTPDGKTLIIADGNGSIYLWDIATRSIYATLTNPSS
jgi:hypothetical protein